VANMPAEDIAHLEELAGIWRRRLRFLETQCAAYGTLAVPAHIALEREDAEQQLAQALAELRRLRPSPSADRPPYLGLLTFQESNADLFFGRDALVADLVERVRRAPLLAVLGASGSGKSSVVRAGLVPMLRGGALPGSQTWRYITLRPSARPLDTLAAELAKLHGDPTAVAQYGQTLNTGERALLLLADALLDRANGQRLVLVIDQFEELWTLLPSEQGQRDSLRDQQHKPFIRLLLAAIAAPDTPLLVVLTMRADFLHHAAEDAALAHVIGEHVLIVSPMSPDQLQAAIMRPAELVGGAFEPGLVGELVEKVAGQPGALPLLEYTLAELWRQRRDDGFMTWAVYRELGGVEGALAARAETILAERYTADQHVALRQVLVRLVQPGEGAADTRRRVRLDDLVPSGDSPDSLYTLLKPFIDERLLTSGRDSASDEETLEVSHEALIRAWPTFGRWIGEARADLRLQLQLEEAAQEWQANDENTDLLWHGLRLSNAEAWLERARPRLNVRDQRFIDASHAQHQAQLAAEQARAAADMAAYQRELDQARILAANAVQLRRRAIYLGLTLIVTFVAVAIAGWFWVRQDEAIQNSIRVRVLNLIGLARERSQIAPRQSLLLALEAQTAAGADGPSASVVEEGLRELLAGMGDILLPGHTAPVTDATFSPDGQWVATGSDDGTARLWRAASPEHPVAVLRGHSEPVRALVFSPNSRQLATAAGDSTVRLWDIAAPERAPIVLRGHTLDVVAVAFSPDGRYLATASDDTTAALWRLDQLGAPYAILGGHAGNVLTLAFSPNSQWLATGGDDGTLRLWAVDRPEREHSILREPGHSVLTLAFSPDSRQIAVGSDDGKLRLWAVDAPPQAVVVAHEHDQAVFKVAFSPDGRWLADGSLDGTVLLLSTATPDQGAAVLPGRGEPVSDLAFSADSQWLAAGSSTGSVQLWRTDTPKRLPIELRGHERMIRAVAFSPDSRWFVTASDDQTARLWRVNTPETSPVVLRGHTQAVSAAAFSPDSRRLAIGSDAGAAQLWEIDHPERPPVALPGGETAVSVVAFSPDGRQVAVGIDRVVALWRVDGPALASIELAGHTDSLTALAFSQDGHWLASSSYDGTARLWRLDGAATQAITLTGHDGWVRALAFSPDSQWLATGGQDDTARLWRVGAPVSDSFVLPGHAEDVVALAFSPDSQWLATGSDDGSARLWDVTQPGSDPIVLLGHAQSVGALAFSPDGRWLATGGLDNIVRLWEVAAPTREPVALLGHDGGIKAVAFSADNRFLATGSGDGTVRLWQVNAIDRGSVRLSSQAQGLFGLAFSPDSRWLATVGADGTAQLWHTRVEELASLACTAAGRNLTLEEWRQFVSPEIAYRSICPKLPLPPSVYYAMLARGEVDAALSSYASEQQLDVILEPPAAWLVRLAGGMLADGRSEWQEPAIAAYRRALTLDSTLRLADPNVLSTLCALGDRERYAADIVHACDLAVAFDPDHGNFRYNRAFVRMQLDNLSGAAEDLEKFIVWAQGHPLGEQRQAEARALIEKLKAGVNPLK
jgi:WD40 repeat protein